MSEAKEEKHAMPQLPEHLVENIVARILFPSILKARMLSKEWKFKFSFVARRSFFSWPEYFSFYRKSEVVGYDTVVDSFKRMPVCSAKLKLRRKEFSSCGTLVVALTLNDDGKSLEGTVNNVLTRKCKKIVCSLGRHPTGFTSILVPMGAEHYELVIWYNWYSHCSYYRVGKKYTTFMVYNSGSGTWIEKPYITRHDLERVAYMDGTIYYITGDKGEPLRFVRFNIQSGDQTETPIRWMDREATVHFTVKCGSHIMSVITDSRNLIVFQLDTESSTLVEVSRTLILEEDWYSFSRYGLHWFAASRNRVYLTSSLTVLDKARLLFIYEVDSKTWSRRYLPKEFTRKLEPASSLHFVLELGLNPFVEP